MDWIRILTCLVCLGLVALAADAEPHEIGTVGVTFESGDWEPARMTQNLGDDQFRLVGDNVFLVFLERFVLLEQRTDYLNVLEPLLGNIETRLQEAELDPEVGYERYEAFTRATRRVTGKASAIPIGYQFDVVSAGDGVGYVLLSWTATSNVRKLSDAMDEAVLALRFPGEGSAWYEKSRRSAHRYVFDDWTVELSFRDSVFTEDDSIPQERYSLEADEGSLAVHLFVSELDGDVDDALAEVRRAATDGEPYDDLVYEDLDLEIGPGRQLLMRSRDEPTHDLMAAVVDLGDGRWIDLRMVTDGPTGHREELWKGLVESLRASKEEPVDAFPTAETPPDTTQPPFLTPAARQLLESSRFLAVSSWSHDVEVSAGGDLLIHEGRRILRVPADADPGAAEPAVLYRSDNYLSGTAVSWGDETMLVRVGEEVRWIVDGELLAAGFRADRAAASDADLVLARSRERGTLLGLGQLPVVGASQIVVRVRDGEERLVLELPGRRVDALAARHGRALIAATPRSHQRDGTEASVQLLLVDLEQGSAHESETHESESWREVRRIVAADGGWLVSGTAPNGEEGVYFLADSGTRERLLSGGPTGLALDERSLTFAANPCLEPPEEGGACIYRAPLDTVRRHGPGFWPMTVPLFEQIPAAAFEQVRSDGSPPGTALPQTRQEVAALAGAAEEAARELTGYPLPSSDDGVDTLLVELAAGGELSADGVAMLAVLVADHLLRNGAVWVPPVTPGPVRLGSSGWEADNALAVGLHPVGVVSSTLFDDEGWYEPMRQIGERARGRTFFVGTDRETVRDAIRAADLQDLDDLLRDGSTDELAAMLADRSRNVFLRDHVYRHLAAYGREESLATVAAPFAAADDADAIDLVAVFAGRLADELAAPQIDELIGELRSAIEKEPAEDALYLLLGAAYERSSAADRMKYARACYQKAEEMSGWGHVADAAEEALERIADE